MRIAQYWFQLAYRAAQEAQRQSIKMPSQKKKPTTITKPTAGKTVIRKKKKMAVTAVKWAITTTNGLSMCMIYESRKQFTLEMLGTLCSQNGDSIRITGHEPFESDFSVIGKWLPFVSASVTPILLIRFNHFPCLISGESVWDKLAIISVAKTFIN